MNLNKLSFLEIQFEMGNLVASLSTGNCSDEITLNIGGLHTFLCIKDEFNEFVQFDDDKVIIDDVEFPLLHIETETVEEEQRFFDRIQQQEVQS